MHQLKLVTLLFCIITVLNVAGCGGYVPATISGTVSGLSSGATVSLLNNGRETITVGNNGSFSFATEFYAQATYSVVVLTQPHGESCTVANGNGTINSAVDSVSNVLVTCVPAGPVGGTVSGLSSGTTVILKNNGADLLSITSNGPFFFANAVTSGSSYSVAVATQPSGETCTVSNGTGTVDASLSNTGNVVVNCVRSALIGGTVAGLTTGTGIYLKNNGADLLFIASNGSFSFFTGLTSGSAYNVTVSTPPAGKTCTVINGTGIVDANLDNVGNISVNCVSN